MIAMIALLCQLSAPSWGWKSVSEQTKECHAFYASCLLKRAYAHVLTYHRDKYSETFTGELLSIPVDLAIIRASSVLTQNEVESFLLGCAAERGEQLGPAAGQANFDWSQNPRGHKKPEFDPKKPYQVPQKRPTLDEIFSDKEGPNRDSEIMKKYNVKPD